MELEKTNLLVGRKTVEGNAALGQCSANGSYRPGPYADSR